MVDDRKKNSLIDELLNVSVNRIAGDYLARAHQKIRSAVQVDYVRAYWLLILCLLVHSISETNRNLCYLHVSSSLFVSLETLTKQD